MDGPLYTSKSPNWRTPNAILDTIRKVAPIGLDPCASQDAETWFAERNWAIEGEYGDPRLDGLRRSWVRAIRPGTLGYANPPYGTRQTWIWSAKAAAEGTAGAQLILLTPARTDTIGFHHDLIGTGSAHCFWKGRIVFDLPPEAPPDANPANGATFPSLFTYWGDNNGVERFCRAFSPFGWVPQAQEEPPWL